jgi:hypothetical protein
MLPFVKGFILLVLRFGLQECGILLGGCGGTSFETSRKCCDSLCLIFDGDCNINLIF